MKRELSPTVTIGIIGAVVLALIVGAVIYFRSGSVASNKPIKATPWSPPGAWSGAPGTGGQGGTGAPTAPPAEAGK